MFDLNTILMAVGLLLLTWDCIEVGRNDAANLVNGVFGARVMRRRTAVWLAGVAVILGASFASPVMETARRGIFDPGQFTLQQALVVYITVYIVDTLLLYTYSAFGMPVSTTASLIFELVGAAIAVGWSIQIIHWPQVGTVLNAIGMSIVLSGVAGFMIQRMFRAAIQDEHTDHLRVVLHGPWIAGLMLTWLAWFMVLKGMKALPWIGALRERMVAGYGIGVSLLLAWAACTLLIHVLISLFQERVTRHLFSATAILGMLCLSFAFGQNDLANCASPGLSAFWLWRHAEQSTAAATRVPLPIWALFICGLLMVMGMATRGAQRVTRAAVNTGSQFDHIALYAPGWCRALARLFLRPGRQAAELAPPPQRDPRGKRLHFDPLRASVIMAVSASVIAFASSSGLPVSTTYVTFAAVVATALGDRTMARGDADLKIGRAIWVVFSWFTAALIAMLCSAGVALMLLKLGLTGLIICLAANFALRRYVRCCADRHELRYHPVLPAPANGADPEYDDGP
ncbi:MAG: inorganic phosphate transporter [Candidatus Marinimicrobia bacterium]|nr:inorganic phosphate transporter [Candidatus Neomarinimicrobiota bacterium]